MSGTSGRGACPAQHLASVQTPVIPVMGALIRDSPGTLSLGQGMVNWGPPPAVQIALREALLVDTPGNAPAGNHPDLNAYGPVEGEPELRAAIARHLRQEHNLDLSGSALLVTAGSNMAFNAVVQVLCDPGDELILPVPYYFNHAMAIQLAGGVPLAVEAGVVPDPERLATAITPRTRAIVTVSPNNPSGAVLPRTVLEAINRLCAERGLLHLHDEAYALFGYGGAQPWSPASQPGSGAHTVSFGSLSKSHGMAGWRLGWAVVPEALMPALAKVQDTVLICAPRLVQHAAVAALEAGGDWCRDRIATLADRRQQVLEALAIPGAPWRLMVQPEGAFYALLELDSPLPADTAMERLIREHGVALVSGSSFGLTGCCLRLSYGMLGEADLAKALTRLTRGLEQLAAG
ncbi:aminotransferase class I/II-fold pyridoxal phosphate-dependent enzyme [Vulcanococcus limneticus]|uniref:aminotransferase class I/II-fold pyridoxal phosphate-dependent enzyme n=1 Tax=Vulcanococcus limneticus TaxID=2170428 RepID=UPI00398C0F47